MDWKDIYKLPLSESHVGRIYDANNNFVFQFLHITDKAQKDLLAILNGEQRSLLNHHIVYENGFIIVDNIKILLIRGWGNLTGVGAHHLNEHDAVQVQDSFAHWIIEKIKE